MSFIIEIGHELAYPITTEGKELSGEILDAMRDCSASGDCEAACQYVLDTYSPEFHIVKKVDGDYQNVIATPEDKQLVCEAIYFESEPFFSDEDMADLYLVWEAASNLDRWTT